MMCNLSDLQVELMVGSLATRRDVLFYSVKTLETYVKNQTDIGRLCMFEGKLEEKKNELKEVEALIETLQKK